MFTGVGWGVLTVLYREGAGLCRIRLGGKKMRKEVGGGGTCDLGPPQILLSSVGGK